MATNQQRPSLWSRVSRAAVRPTVRMAAGDWVRDGSAPAAAALLGFALLGIGIPLSINPAWYVQRAMVSGGSDAGDPPRDPRHPVSATGTPRKTPAAPVPALQARRNDPGTRERRAAPPEPAS